VEARTRLLAAAAAVAVAAGAGYAGHRLWVKSDAELAPVVIEQHADATALVRPSLGRRLEVLARREPAASSNERLIALTFDDGPYPVTTPLLLQTLRELHVPGTFFLIGRDAEQFPDLARAILADGNEIGDHTLTHPDLDRLDDAAAQREIVQGAAALRSVVPTPSEARIFRPPHGRYTLGTIRVAQAAGFDTILWSDDPGDWRSISEEAIRAHILKHATAPEIVLLHSGRVTTIEALPKLVAQFRQAGYTFVTVSELLRRTSPMELNRPAKLSLVEASVASRP
jgi:peptidoglycan-N-acetylglucosamine deacetylase